MQAFDNTEAYIAAQDISVRERLEKIRKAIRSVAPHAEESISYGMPAFKYLGPLVYFAAFKNHIGFFPTGSGVRQFEGELGGYSYSKGTIQFPHNKAIPIALIKKITAFRVKENEDKAASKKKKTKSNSATPKTAKALVPGLSAPATRALEAAGISSLPQLATFSREQLLALHGLGPSAIPRIEKALAEAGLSLR